MESLTESRELDVIFPILLEAMNFHIISTPKQTKGLAQYGKDVVAIGIDETDGVKKRFYFEVKGGADRHITTGNYSGKDGIRESIVEAKDRPFPDSSIPNFEKLPIKIVVVHNGEIKANVKETFDGFIAKLFPTPVTPNKTFLDKLFGREPVTPMHDEFERWDIFKLTDLFSRFLFSEYLLTDDEAITQFKRVLVDIGNPQNDFKELYLLIDKLVEKLEHEANERKQKVLLESLNLVAYIVYTSAKENNNLEPAKRSIPYIVLKLWSWLVVTNKVDTASYKGHFDKILSVYLTLLEEYFIKLLPIAELNNGLLSDTGGRYEQFGYPVRTLDFLGYYIFFTRCLKEGLYPRSLHFTEEKCSTFLLNIVNNNMADKPILDNHSIPILLIYDSLREVSPEEAKNYLKSVVDNIIISHTISKRLPEAGNNLEFVIRYSITHKKSVFYVDSTSLLFGMLFELLAVNDMEDVYQTFREFVTGVDIDIAIFIPFDDAQMKTFMPEEDLMLEPRLFSKQIQMEGYQSQIVLEKDFQEFKRKTKAKNEFNYTYKSDSVNNSSMRVLAHHFYKTPFFPNHWRGEIL